MKTYHYGVKQPMGLITLLTDFGHTDSYVGVMKGVIANICPRCRWIDLTHGIAPQDILAARFNLLSSYGYFPAGTVHVVVVDPGVGTERAALAAEVDSPRGMQRIIAPDNGLLTGFTIQRVVALTNSDYWRAPHPSSTFHGRDIFAPAAAHLANGVPLDSLGNSLSVNDLLHLNIGSARATSTGYSGSIQYIDHFGNVITNIPHQALRAGDWRVYLGDACFDYHRTYGQTPLGTALALIGSHGYVELAVNGGSAADRFTAQIGHTLRLVYGI